MGLRADRAALLRAAAGWDGVSDELAIALAMLPGYQPRGDAFGYPGRVTGVDDEHDTFLRAMVDAVDQGVRSTRILAEGLRDTARDFGATDTAVADEFHTPEGGADPMSYQNHERFADEVDRRLGRLKGEIEAGITRVIAAFDFNAKLLLGGTGGVPGAQPGMLVAYALAKDDLEEAIGRLRGAYRQAVTDTKETVERFEAAPHELDHAMADAYIDASERLSDEDQVVRTIDNDLRAHWEGLAFDAYLRASDQQRDATVAVAAGLRDAAVACQDAAASIRQGWSEVVSAINSATSDVGEKIDAGTETSGWVSFDPGPAIGVLDGMTLRHIGCENDVQQDLTGTLANTWLGLNEGLPGLKPVNEWPRVQPGDRVAIDDPDNWQRR